MSSETFQVEPGAIRKYGRTITSDGVTAVTDVFTGVEAFAVEAWAGDDRAAIGLSGSGAAWDDAAAGTWTLTLDGDDFADVVAGTYALRVRLTGTADGSPRTILRGDLEVLGAPGAAEAPRSYCTWDDCLAYCEALSGALKGRASQSNFAEQRHNNSVALDHMVARRRAADLGHRPASDAWELARSDTLGTLGDADGSGTGLLAAGDAGRPVREWVARMTAADILEDQVGDDEDYVRVAELQRRRAREIERSLIVRVDTVGDGSAGAVVDFGRPVRAVR